MANTQNNARGSAQHTRDAINGRQREAVAQDMKARGLNPVTVSDLKQRHGVGNVPGRGFLSTLLHRG